MKKTCAFLLTILIGASGFAQDKAGFITLLGNDTMVAENFVFSDHDVEAWIVIRTPVTQYRHYKMRFDEEYNLMEYLSKDFDPKVSLENPVSSITMVPGDNGFTIKTLRNNEENTLQVGSERDALIFIDMVHWPYEVVYRKMARHQLITYDQPLLMGRRVGNFQFTANEGLGTIRHPSRGTMTTEISPSGELMNLDAGETTRKLFVRRTAPLDILKLVRHYTKLDEMGMGVGSLSGAATSDAVVGGANISISYGQPSRRGRDLFGGIVPWGERWRTGANRATHFKTDKDLMFGSVLMPAGEYTLFTIPEPDGGILIINKQTGQNGQSYNEELDLGRVRMMILDREENVELFTIEAVESQDGGLLRLTWGNTSFEIPFKVSG